MTRNAKINSCICLVSTIVTTGRVEVEFIALNFHPTLLLILIDDALKWPSTNALTTEET